MSWTPVSNTVPQYSADASGTSASGYYLKFYADGTTTPISMATDSTGGTLLAKCQLDSLGYPTTDGTVIFIPHIDQTYKLALYTNATDADNNTLASAVWVVDNVSPVLTFQSESDKVKNFATLAAAVADTDLVDGDALNISERTTGNGGGAIWDVVLSSTVTENTFNIVQCTGVPTLSLVLRIDSGYVDGDSFGLVATSSADTSQAANNLACWNEIVSYLDGTGGKITLGNGYYYTSGEILITNTGYWIDGAGDPYTSASLGTHIATTQTTGDVIKVDDSVRAVAGFRISNLAIIGNKNVVGATDGNCLNIECSQGLGRAHSLINVHDVSLINAFDNGMIWQAASPSNFIFNCRIDNVNTRVCGGDGIKLTGQVSQVSVDKIYSENNAGHQFNLDDGCKAISVNRLTCSLGQVGQAGCHIQSSTDIDIHNVYMEDTAGANFIIRSARNLNIIGGAIDQLLATSTGVLIGTNAANDQNKDITIDIPGWTKGGSATANYIDLTTYPGGIICDGLYLGKTADSALDSNDVDGYSTVFFADRIRFLYENFRDLPSIAVQSGAGTGATVSFTAGTVSTDRRGRFSLTHGTGAWGASAQVRVTFNAPFDNPPVVHLQPESTTSATQSQTNGVSCVVTNTYFELTFATALSAQPSFLGQWSYMVSGDQQ